MKDTEKLYLLAIEAKGTKQANEDLHSFISFLFYKLSVDFDTQTKLINEWWEINK